NESKETPLVKPKHIIRKELVPDWLKVEHQQEEPKQETEVTVEQQLEMIQLKQDLGQELTSEEESLLEEHSSTYSLLEIAQVKQDLGQVLTPEEQECLNQHNQLKDTAS
ncbi:replication protein, partial [Priestia megaterium]